jgi:hypothetical protein
LRIADCGLRIALPATSSAQSAIRNPQSAIESRLDKVWPFPSMAIQQNGGVGAEATSCRIPQFEIEPRRATDGLAGKRRFFLAKVTIFLRCKCLGFNTLRKTIENNPKIAKKLVVKSGGFAYCPP